MKNNRKKTNDKMNLNQSQTIKKEQRKKNSTALSELKPVFALLK